MPTGQELYDSLPNLHFPDEPNTAAEEILKRDFAGHRKVRAVVVGGGLAGITLGTILPRKLDNLDLVIYERWPETGGVWHRNTYPGVKCDIPSHNYQLSFDPKTDWSATYAPGEEIKGYWHGIEKKYGVDKLIKTNHDIQSADWDAEKGKWIFKIKDLNTDTEFTDEAEFFIQATGILNNARYPPYQPGFDDFQGPKFHPSQWPKDLSLKGKRVALIGNGASGVQILPQLLAQGVSHVDHYAKRGTWISQHVFGKHLPPHREYTPEEIAELRNTEKYHKFRKDLETRGQGNIAADVYGSEQNRQQLNAFLLLMYERLGGDEELFKKVVPDYAPGSRRFLPAPGYLESLTDPRVSYHLGTVKSFTKTGVVGADDVDRPVDIIVASTGYTRANGESHAPNFEVTGLDGTNLKEHFSGAGSKLGYTNNYYGITSPHFPNYFYVLAQNSYLFCGPAPIAAELWSTYISKVIRKVQLENIKSLVVSEKAALGFSRVVTELSKASSTSRGIDGFFVEKTKDGEYRIALAWPGTITHAVTLLREPRWEDYDYEYLDNDNPFSFFGNGHTFLDFAPKGDKTFFVQTGVPPKALHEEYLTIPRDHVAEGYEYDGTGDFLKNHHVGLEDDEDVKEAVEANV